MQTDLLLVSPLHSGCFACRPEKNGTFHLPEDHLLDQAWYLFRARKSIHLTIMEVQMSQGVSAAFLESPNVSNDLNTPQRIRGM